MDTQETKSKKKKEFEARLLLEARQEIAVMDYLEKSNGTSDGISEAIGIPVNRVTAILKTYQGMGMVRKSGVTWRLASLEEQRASQGKKQLTLFSK
jgi:DNA-binding MarR family transcriptional regulator